MVMQMRGDKCYPGRGKWVKIPFLSENVDKRSVNKPETLERVMAVMSLSELASFYCFTIIAIPNFLLTDYCNRIRNAFIQNIGS